MKEASKRRLYADRDRICEQIGILQEEKPKLVLDRKEYHALKVTNGQSKRAAWSGECNFKLRAIFIDASK